MAWMVPGVDHGDDHTDIAVYTIHDFFYNPVMVEPTFFIGHTRGVLDSSAGERPSSFAGGSIQIPLRFVLPRLTDKGRLVRSESQQHSSSKSPVPLAPCRTTTRKRLVNNNHSDLC